MTRAARQGESPQDETAAGSAAPLSDMYREELQRYYDAILLKSKADATHHSSFLCEMVRQAFILPPDKLNLLAAFFNTSADDKVSLEQFIRGMTLLDGDLKQLLINSEPSSPPRSRTAPSSPTAPLDSRLSEFDADSEHVVYAFTPDRMRMRRRSCM